MKNLLPILIFTCLLTVAFAGLVAYRHQAIVEPESIDILKPAVRVRRQRPNPPPVYMRDRTILVDKVKTISGMNYLFRGSLPLDEKSNLTYEKLAQDVGIVEGINLRKFRLIIVSLVHRGDQFSRSALKAELQAANASEQTIQELVSNSKWPPGRWGVDLKKEYKGDKISLVWHPIAGCNSEASCEEVEELFQLRSLITHLSELMSRPTPTVVYVHCTSGADRVAAVVGAYQLEHLGRDLITVVEAPSPKGAPLRASALRPEFKYLIEWYARLLEKEKTAQRNVRH